MKKFLRNVLPLVALMLLPWAANAQQAVVVTASSPYTEGFEGSGSGLPTGWTQTTGNYTWSVTTGDDDTWNSISAHGGTYNALCAFDGADLMGTKLISPVLDLSGLTVAQLTFWRLQRDYYGDNDELTVYYRTSATAAWTVLATYTSAIEAWTETTITLPNVSETYQIAFEAISNWGYGIAIDDITIGAPPSCMPVSGLTAAAVDVSSITLSWSDALNDAATYRVGYWTTADTTWTTATDTFLTVSGLDAATNYNFSVAAVCSESDESTPVTGSFRTDCEGGSCFITINATDSYGDGWNGNAINVMQGGALVGSATIVSGSSNTVQIPVCSGSPVTLTFTSGGLYSYPDEMGGTVTDGGGTTIFTIEDMDEYQTGAVLATIANPCPSCIPPSELTVMTDSTQIELSWTANSGATQFAVYLNDSLIDDNVTNNSFLFQNLDINTPYTVGVRAICTADDSSSIASLSASTTCGQMQLPYFEDFEDVAAGQVWPSCWNLLNSYTYSNWGEVEEYPMIISDENHTLGGDNAIEMLASNNYNMFASSAIPLEGNNIYVRFWARHLYGWMKAGVMTNPYDTSTFIPLVNISGSEWTEYEFNTAALDPDATYYAAWKGFGTSSWYAIGLVDDIYISEIPACVRVTEVRLDSASSEEMHLSWTDLVNEGATYTVKYWELGGTDSVTVTANDTLVTLNELEANTLYQMIVTPICADGEAESSPVFAFRTGCDDLVLPFFDDFDSYDNGFWPPCWHRLMADGTDPSVNDQFHHSAPQAMFLLSHNNDTNLFCTPSPIPTTGDNIYVRYWAYMNYYSGGTKWIKAGVMTDTADVSTFIMLDSVGNHNFNDVFEEREFNTANLDPNATYWVAWMYVSDYNYTYGSSRGAIDDVYISEIPSCQRVSDITVDNVTAEGLTLHWVDNGNAGNFTISYWTSGSDTTEVTTSDNYYDFDELDANTLYTFSVVANCSSDDAEPLEASFRTACGAMSIPFTEGFEDAGALSCWQMVNCVSSTGQYTGSSTPHTGNGCFRFYYTVTPPEYLISPELAGTENGVKVEFYYKRSSYAETFKVGYSTTSDSLTAFTWGNEITASTNYQLYSQIMPAGTKYVAVQYTYNDGLALYLDDFNFMLPPSCLPVYALTVDSVTATEAFISWAADANQTDWYVKVGDDIYDVSNDPSFTIPNLEARTSYTVYVAANCSGDTSEWVSVDLMTACAGGSCDIVVNMVDSYGDGWNGAKLNLYQNDALVGSATLPSGSTAQANINVCSGMTVVHSWQSGSYDSECSYTISDAGGNVFYNSGNGGVNNTDSIANACPACPYPANVVAAPNTTDAVLTWTCTDPAATFAVEYRQAGNNSWSAPAPVSATTYTVTGLSAASAYEVRVGTLCGTDTLWTAISFQTNCDVLGVPYFEDFDAYAEHVLPPCWTLAIPGTSLATNSGVTHYDGGLFFRSNYGGAANFAVVPELNGSITKLKIEFDVKVGTPAENDGILIGVADAAGTLIAWLDTLQDANFSRNAFVHKTVYFPNYNIPNGAARVALAQLRNWGQWALIDNIDITVLPGCYPVDNVEGQNLIDPEATYFTWDPVGGEEEWQVYVDTVTVGIDDLAALPESSFTTVYSPSYDIPVGAIMGGGIYNFFVRANCGSDQSTWVKTEFGAGTVIMENNTVPDTVVGCGFVVYDNGGPVAGYLENSNSTLVILTENAGSQLQVFGAKFGIGASGATLTVYDGVGTSGAVLYTYNTTDGRDTLLNTNLATSTTGALTITFVSNGTMCHTGYELYVHCVGQATCARPTELQGTMTSATSANVTWNGTAANYNFYYRLNGTTAWTRRNVNTNSVALTGLTADTVYDMYVVALCSATDSSAASNIRQLNTHAEVPQPGCDPVTGVAVSEETATTAKVSWTAPAGQNRWEVALGTNTYETTNNPYTLTGLNPNTNYTVKVRALCSNGQTSAWSREVSFTTLSGEGIEDVDNAHISLYPNPATHAVTLSGVEQGATVTVIDMNGRTVATHHAAAQSLTLDLTGYAKGTYFVRVTGSTASTVRKLVVK